MSAYRSLLLGCGPRANEHVDVYRDIPNMEMVGCCDLIEERRRDFMERYKIPEGYEDYETALKEVQPDIVHVCTSPFNRVWEVEVTADAGVKAAIYARPKRLRLL